MSRSAPGAARAALGLLLLLPGHPRCYTLRSPRASAAHPPHPRALLPCGRAYTQAADGRPLYMHPLDTAVALAHFGSYERLPAHLRARVLQIEALRQTEVRPDSGWWVKKEGRRLGWVLVEERLTGHYPTSPPPLPLFPPIPPLVTGLPPAQPLPCAPPANI